MGFLILYKISIAGNQPERLPGSRSISTQTAVTAKGLLPCCPPFEGPSLILPFEVAAVLESADGNALL